jgi:hypothetical protein
MTTMTYEDSLESVVIEFDYVWEVGVITIGQMPDQRFPGRFSRSSRKKAASSCLPDNPDFL